ncbi:hypothetical protein [Acidithiobacillus sulfurivorans]|uniref:TIR domain-containing protein n=1 Tax=Acidithiobacillus sulfurivorans TaxID=1958756 RepID=A0ABS5ZXH6_9PROT|nr:hypothetical protein [Acidithiobacillus sulfurivorans]MBU2759923.1 hypothetical protein [Acidithiobacillus sulfurivorans]
MNQSLFIFALENMRSSDWEHFEELSSRFLASDFPELRTMANPSGDGGRDSELFSSEGNRSVVIQYSVAIDWNKKIDRTLNRIKETNQSVRVLIYVTNKKIGAGGDKIKSKCMSEGVSLDIRDISWFSERMNLDDNKYYAANEFCNIVALPLLEGQKIIETSRPSLTTIESKAALVYLAMQWEDEQTDKGLSKVTYEALVLAALRSTNSDNRLSRSDIHRTIFSYLTSTKEKEIEAQVDGALRRLTRRKIRHWQADDEFCLTHEEVVRLRERLAETKNQEKEFLEEVEQLLKREMKDKSTVSESVFESFIDRILRILDDFLLKTGEAFAVSVASGEVCFIDRNILYNAVYSDISKYPEPTDSLETFPDIALNVIARITTSKNTYVISHLRKISDSYTLFSFLRETPDVQRATKKIFGHGKIWLDTTIILPVLAEYFCGEDDPRRYTSAVSSLISAGVELRITTGVIQEVLHHILISIKCSTYIPREWKGRIPFLYYHYIQAGYNPSSFGAAVENFRGNERPEEDICEYLQSQHGIIIESLDDASREVDDDLRHAVERLWREAHDVRRSSSDESSGSGETTEILIRHDVESYLGIIALRKKENASELGYKNWWLTTDSLAWKIKTILKKEVATETSSPLMSLDFLLNSLSFGPARSKFDRTHEQLLPVLLDVDFSVHYPVELLELADRIRKENEGSPDRLIKRKIRDACDQMKGKYGELTRSVDQT